MKREGCEFRRMMHIRHAVTHADSLATTHTHKEQAEGAYLISLV